MNALRLASVSAKRGLWINSLTVSASAFCDKDGDLCFKFCIQPIPNDNTFQTPELFSYT